MPTKIHLFHIGEVVLATLLQELGARRCLAVPCLIHADCTVATVLAAGGLQGTIRFTPDVPLAPIPTGETALLFDGVHCVDVLAHDEAATTAVAFEAKLGLNRLSRGEFEKRFLVGATLTKHKPPRVKGSMMAILSHRSIDPIGDVALRATLDFPRSIARPWFLVVRRSTWRQWSGARNAPSQLSPDTHVLCFEDIASQHGDSAAFDLLVHRLLGDGFSAAWDLDLRPPDYAAGADLANKPLQRTAEDGRR